MPDIYAAIERLGAKGVKVASEPSSKTTATVSNSSRTSGRIACNFHETASSSRRAGSCLPLREHSTKTRKLQLRH
ncbi:MAG: hypothetical protein ACLP1W_10635 [Rhodomicrobium sp.]